MKRKAGEKEGRKHTKTGGNVLRNCPTAFSPPLLSDTLRGGDGEEKAISVSFSSPSAVSKQLRPIFVLRGRKSADQFTQTDGQTAGWTENNKFQKKKPRLS